jgi:DNA polymerase
MFVGEMPGRTDDETGEPYSGRTGEMLTRLLRAMGYSRAEVYLTMVVKCHAEPSCGTAALPGDGWKNVQQVRYKAASAESIRQCSPFLRAEIAAVRPAVVVAFGNLATRVLVGAKVGIEEARGNWIAASVGDVQLKVMPTYSLQYAVRDPRFAEERKRAIWSDMREVVSLLRAGAPDRVD